MMTQVMEAGLCRAEVRKLVLGAIREVAQVQLYLRSVEQRDARYAVHLDGQMSAAAAVDDELSAKLGEPFEQARRCLDAPQKVRRLEALLRVMAEHAAMTQPPNQAGPDGQGALSNLEGRLRPLLIQHNGLSLLGDRENDQFLATKVERLYQEYLFALRSLGFDIEPFLIIAGDPVWTNRRAVLFESIPAALARLRNA